MRGAAAARAALLASLLAAAALSGAVPANAGAAEGRLLAADGAESDHLGDAVAIEGDTAVVGAFFDDGGEGAVYVFERIGNTWSQTGKLTAAVATAGDRLGTSVAIDGDTIVAGAPGESSNRGAVYTFARAGAAQRSETARLTAGDGMAGDNLGHSVAVDGDTIVAGARFADVGMSADQGAVYTFATAGAPGRNDTGKLTASDGAGSDFLGHSVAVDGDTIVAGATNDDGANQNEGSAYTFARTGATARTETAKLIAAENTALADDSLGYSVAIDGDTILAGAPYDDLGTNLGQGSVLTFARTGAALRANTSRLRVAAGAASDYLGMSVAIEGDGIVAGAPGSGGTGAVFTFDRVGTGNRTETGNRSSATGAVGDELGDSVAISGETILAGAPYDNVGTEPGQGSASVFFTEVPESGARPPAATPLTPVVVDRVKPVLNRARLSRTRLRRGRGATLSYSLSEAATVAIRIERKSRGRRVRGRCRKASVRNRRRARCTLWAHARSLSRRSPAGVSKIAFSVRVAGRTLGPGTYRMTLTPTDAAGNRGAGRRLRFTVVRGRR